MHFNIITTFSNFIQNFRLVAKYQFAEAIEVLDKTQKRGVYVRLSYLNCNLKLYIR